MNNNKQSSVDWLIEQIVNNNGVNKLTFKQAQAMHKEEHKQFIKNYFEWHKLMGFVSHKPEDIDEYYNETFGGNDEQQ